MSQAKNHQWLQSIHYLLDMHGFSDIWNNPSIPGDTFHKAFKLQADDQFNQSMIGKLQSSSRFTTLKEISDNRGNDSYIHIIRNPRIRNIFLRLRIDMNILSTFRSSKNILSSCPLCSREPETVKHFILKCCRFADEREKFIDSITSYTHSEWKMMYIKWNTFWVFIVHQRLYRIVVNTSLRYIH